MMDADAKKTYTEQMLQLREMIKTDPQYRDEPELQQLREVMESVLRAWECGTIKDWVTLSRAYKVLIRLAQYDDAEMERMIALLANGTTRRKV